MKKKEKELELNEQWNKSIETGSEKIVTELAVMARELLDTQITQFPYDFVSFFEH